MKKMNVKNSHYPIKCGTMLRKLSKSVTLREKKEKQKKTHEQMMCL